MKKRCYNPNTDRYKNYGALGVIVCDEWKEDFKAFYDWCILNKWERHLQIDRIDVYANYTPDNCQLIDHIEQGFNKKNTKYINVRGKDVSLAKLMYINGKSEKYRTVWAGLKIGKDIEYYLERYELNKIP